MKRRLPTSPRLGLTTRRRRIAAATLLVAVVAGAVAAAMANIGRAAPLPAQLRDAKDVDAVVAQVQRSFGDRRIVSASVDGSLLTVTLSVPHSTDIGAADTFENRSVFEAQVLGHAVADWMRAHGQQPITTVRYRDTQGRSLRGWSLNGDPVGADPNVSPLAPGTCEATAKSAVSGQASLTVASANTLPWINGTCVFVFQTTDPVPGSAASADALQRIILTIGHPPNVRPWFFELDSKGSGLGLTNAGWMPDGTGFTAAKPGLTYPLAHG
jgi:hypothetical protein